MNNRFQDTDEFMSMRTMVNSNQNKRRLPLLFMAGIVLVGTIVIGVNLYVGAQRTLAGKPTEEIIESFKQEDYLKIETHILPFVIQMANETVKIGDSLKTESTDMQTTTEISDVKGTRTYAETFTEKLLTIFKEEDFAEIRSYIFPAVIQSMDTISSDNSLIASKYLAPFYTPELEFLNYEVLSEEKLTRAVNLDSLKKYSDYIEPSFFTQVGVKISYESQTSMVNFIYACCDDTYYLYTVKELDGGMDFSDYQYSNVLKIDEVLDMLQNNSKVHGGELDGERVFFEDYSMVIPSNWTSTSSASVELSSNDSVVKMNVMKVFEGEVDSIEDFLKQTTKGFCEMAAVVDAGNTVTNAGMAYYWGFYQNKTYSNVIIIPKKDGIYMLMMVKYVKAKTEWDEAMQIATSFQFE